MGYYAPLIIQEHLNIGVTVLNGILDEVLHLIKGYVNRYDADIVAQGLPKRQHGIARLYIRIRIKDRYLTRFLHGTGIPGTFRCNIVIRRRPAGSAEKPAVDISVQTGGVFDNGASYRS